LSWWWTTGSENREIEALKATVKALEHMKLVVETHEKAIDGIQSSQRLIKLEWTDTLDRLNRMTGRLNARIKKSGGLESPESDDREVSRGVAPPTTGTGTHSLLQQARGRRGLLSG